MLAKQRDADISTVDDPNPVVIGSPGYMLGAFELAGSVVVVPFHNVGSCHRSGRNSVAVHFSDASAADMFRELAVGASVGTPVPHVQFAVKVTGRAVLRVRNVVITFAPVYRDPMAQARAIVADLMGHHVDRLWPIS